MYVQRDNTGMIVGVFANPQPDIATEWVEGAKIDTPLPKFQDELAQLNNKYQEDVEAFNKAFSLAIMFDGITEEGKKANIRTLYAARKTKYVADLATLRTQYGT